MQENAAEQQAEVARRRKGIEDLSAQRDELRPDSPLYQQKTEELVTAATQLDVMVKLKEMELARLEKQHVAHLYDEIRAACKKSAEGHHLDLGVAERGAEAGWVKSAGEGGPFEVEIGFEAGPVLYAQGGFLEGSSVGSTRGVA